MVVKRKGAYRLTHSGLKLHLPGQGLYLKKKDYDFIRISQHMVSSAPLGLLFADHVFFARKCLVEHRILHVRLDFAGGADRREIIYAQIEQQWAKEGALRHSADNVWWT